MDKQSESKQQELFNFLISSNNDLRNELKMRIGQRDNFGIQFVIAVGAILSISMSIDSLYSSFIIFLIPILTIFYSVQILSSYSVHERLSYFIREKIEREMAEILGIKNRMDLFWENYCKFDRDLHDFKLPGIRKTFFIYAMFIMPILSELIFVIKILNLDKFNLLYLSLSIILTLLFILFSIYINYSFQIKPLKIEISKLSERDYIKLQLFQRKKVLNKAVFFDRDGTLHVDKVMTRKKEDLEFFDDTIFTLRKYKEQGYKIVIITNQSGIGKGIYTVKEMHNFNKYLLKVLKKNGCCVDAIYYCPHKKSDNCNCHKPKNGMLKRAERELNINLSESVLIGDKMIDIKAGISSGILKNFLVTTGIYYENNYKNEEDIDELKELFTIIDKLSDSFKYFDFNN